MRQYSIGKLQALRGLVYPQVRDFILRFNEGSKPAKTTPVTAKARPSAAKTQAARPSRAGIGKAVPAKRRAPARAKA